MKRQSLPIYLTPEQYSTLREAAVRYGKPMTDIVRDLIDTHLRSAGPPPTDISPLIGTARIGRRTDIARERKQMLEEVLGDIRGHERAVRRAGR